MGSSAVVASTDVMRTLAHELRQPLSTIESIAYYLTLILPEDPKVREQLDRIQQLVEESNWILTSGQLLTDELPLARERVDLQQLAAQLDTRGVRVELEADLPAIDADPALLRLALDNLMTLFRQFSEPATLTVSRGGAGVMLEFSSPATGRHSETALGPGSSLSLDGARRVVEAHHGSLEVAVDPAAGIRVRVMLT